VVFTIKKDQLLFDAKDYLRIGAKNCPLEKGLHIEGLYQGLDPKDCMNNLDD
jgi:hypothetical protein